MKRLLDESMPLDNNDQRLAELFAQAPRAAPDPFRKRRIRARLGAIHPGRLGQAKLFGLKWALLGGSLAFATAAAAMVTHRIGYWGDRTTEVVAATPASKEVPGVGLRERPSAVEPDTLEKQDPAPTLVPSTEPRSVSPRAPVASSEDPALVAGAIQALRNQRNPGKARILLNQYLTNHPRGALAEEALALSIEAADKMKDPQSASLGCKYLALYHGGRHRTLASRACAKAAPEK